MVSGYRRCPINKGEDCVYSNCMWWCDFANDCAVPLLAVLISDSDICRSVFSEKGGD